MIITPTTNTLSEATHSHMRYLFQNVHKSRKTVHDLLDSRQNAIDILFIQEAPINSYAKSPAPQTLKVTTLRGQFTTRHGSASTDVSHLTTQPLLYILINAS